MKISGFKKWMTSLIGGAVFGLGIFAAQAQSEFPLKDGDSWVMVGDSMEDDVDGALADFERDDMVVGQLLEVTYRTKKKFDAFKLVDYYHELGEETGDLPLLRYEPRSEHLYISGGKYQIKMPLVGMSPGIEN